MSTRTDTLFPYPTLFRSGRTARCGRCGRQFRRQGPRISAGTLMADDFDRAMTSPLERVARTPAGHALSRNAEGDMESAGEAVDALWGESSDAALAVLRPLRSKERRVGRRGGSRGRARWSGD